MSSTSQRQPPQVRKRRKINQTEYTEDQFDPTIVTSIGHEDVEVDGQILQQPVTSNIDLAAQRKAARSRKSKKTTKPPVQSTSRNRSPDKPATPHAEGSNTSNHPSHNNSNEPAFESPPFIHMVDSNHSENDRVYRLVEAQHLEPPKTKIKRVTKTQHDYIREFVDRVDIIISGTLSREAKPPVFDNCGMCKSAKAVWRCKDCFLSAPQCRRCIREDHIKNPLHRIECWTGTHFRPAWLHETGVYLLLQHGPSSQHPILCSDLLESISLIDSEERELDAKEQLLLLAGHSPPPSPLVSHDSTTLPDDDQPKNPTPTAQQEQDDDNAFDQELESMLNDLNESLLNTDATDQKKDPNSEPIDSTKADLKAFLEYRRTMVGSQLARPDCVRVVHTNGIHVLEMVTCSCCHNSDDQLLDLCASRLIPSSFRRFHTLFTTPLLDFVRLCNLEFMASSYQFISLLRRLTDPMTPDLVINLYHEFRRMIRVWRWVKKLHWAGYGHKTEPRQAANGELGNFCALCPQPGVNLPPDWEKDADNPIFRRSFVADGNFKADHIYQKGDDEHLFDGAGMFPKEEEYQTFVEQAIERNTRAPCENSFKAIIAAMIASKSCDRTGVAAIACARHGCYCPNALVDLFRGEQQKNIDYALLQAIKTTHVDKRQRIVLLYDIACQYIVHLKDRIGDQLEGHSIDAGIGLFHVHAHKDQCFFRFSPSFIPDLAIVIGEILESLWSKLNEISPSLRTANLSTRSEVMDDHATDSNHKKMLALISSLRQQYHHALSQSTSFRQYFEGLAPYCRARIGEWTKQIEHVEKHRLSDRSLMDVYGSLHDKDNVTSGGAGLTIASESTENLSPADRYLAYALIVEEKQLEVLHKIRMVRPQSSSSKEDGVRDLRQSLVPFLAQLRALEQSANIQYTSSSGVTPSFSEGTDWDIDDDVLPDEIWQGDGQAFEKQVIALPSSGTVTMDLAPTELKLRVQQANNQLTRIRELVADRSLQFSQVKRISPNTATTTRSQQKLKAISSDISLHSRIYERCRERILLLNPSAAIKKRYLKLTKEDVKASTQVLAPNEPGSTSEKLSWIWLSSNTLSSDGTVFTPDAANERLWEFNRVHWLRARALSMRWSEEVKLVTMEMSWAVRYFLHQQTKWDNATQLEDITMGAKAYAFLLSDLFLRTFTMEQHSSSEMSVPYWNTKPINVHPSLSANLNRIITYGAYQMGAIIHYLTNNWNEMDDCRRRWIQKGLRSEFYFFSAHVGMLFSVGQHNNMDVDLIYMALADSLHLALDSQLPIPFDPEWRLVHGQDRTAYFVYYSDWWRSSRPPKRSQLIGRRTIAQAIVQFSHQYTENLPIPTLRLPTSLPNSPFSSGDEGIAFHTPARTASKTLIDADMDVDTPPKGNSATNLPMGALDPPVNITPSAESPAAVNITPSMEAPLRSRPALSFHNPARSTSLPRVFAPSPRTTTATSALFTAPAQTHGISAPPTPMPMLSSVTSDSASSEPQKAILFNPRRTQMLMLPPSLPPTTPQAPGRPPSVAPPAKLDNKGPLVFFNASRLTKAGPASVTGAQQSVALSQARDASQSAPLSSSEDGVRRLESSQFTESDSSDDDYNWLTEGDIAVESEETDSEGSASEGNGLLYVVQGV
ncbi:hypothetical protein CVT24_007599 [Panaeolus cyanescens]|uniref:CxC2-like cysteine cluster KDZ transposase-associated domain-containing protein n=1 Tax=Panaeolus cyanescens TaxID=181874 RepID=A0A409YKJ6_9AGAR|nr:hypothetical protein CVT24_007599 [Panaeolus cyanescens]